MAIDHEPSAPSGPTDASSSVPDRDASSQVTAVPGPMAEPVDGGSMRPLLVFLVVAVVALVGSIVFALARLGDSRGLERLATARVGVVQVVDDGRAAQKGLADEVAAAEKVLAATRGKVVDGRLRTVLADRIDEATEVGAQEPPTVPEPGAAGLEAAEDVEALRARATEWTEAMSTAASTLAAAREDVEASHRQWQDERRAQQARAEKAANRAADLETARKRLATVTDQLAISVRDSAYTLDWSQGLGAPADARTALSSWRTRGQQALDVQADPDDLAAVTALVDRREEARRAIEARAWDVRATVADGTNGRIAIDTLCKVGVGPEGQDQYLRCDAAEAWKKLDQAFAKEFGTPLRVEYGYRPYDWQLQALDEFGAGQVAAPGTSNHGLAVAVDVPVDDGFRFGQPQFEWLAAHGPAQGWVHPEWARAGGGREEPWHFEFVG